MKRFLKVLIVLTLVFVVTGSFLTVSATAPDTETSSSSSRAFGSLGSASSSTSSVGSETGRNNELDSLLSMNFNGNTADTVQIILLLTLISLLPSILLMMTSFTRIIIVFSFLRNALGLQQSPPNQVLIGLALFLTIFIMAPVFTQINDEAIKPYSDGTITQEEFMQKASAPLKDFMYKQTRAEDINMFLSLSGKERPETIDEIGMTVIIPSFITSEIRRAFIYGFLIYLPFLIIDMVVSSALMSMGMIMLPPVMISLPFKILLFVLVDGWGLLIKTLVATFQ